MSSISHRDQTQQKEEMLRKTKMDQSAPFFKNTKVLSCSKVIVKNGQAIAIGFPHKKTGFMAPGSYGNTGKSSEKMSVTQ